ncbi:recombinase family protein [Desulfogranum mediterraneum]|uniref:recombinase family protein n=1 Tax=Desulfogranum mediterraneum TaxID=160661 RepID=UPI0003FA75F6|nr:recombinase family protein [Desulfogranum mediterraneum]
MSKQVGYIRVSSVDQNTGRQLGEMDLDKIFEEKVSGKSMNRPELKAMMDYVREGDHLHVHELSRLGRSVIDLHTIVNELLEKGVTVTFHKENMVFVPGKEADPMQLLMFGMLANFAQFERSLIRQRQQEGIAAAKAAGKHMGRPAKLTDEQKVEIKGKLKQGATPTELAREYGCSRASIYNVKASKLVKAA